MQTNFVKHRIARAFALIAGLGITALAYDFQNDRANQVEEIIQSHGAVLKQYWGLKAADETKEQFVMANLPKGQIIASAKYDEIMAFGDAMTGVLKQGVYKTSPFTVNELFNRSDAITDTVNEEFAFPDPDGYGLSPDDAPIYVMQRAIYGHGDALMDHIRGAWGVTNLEAALYEDILTRYKLPAGIEYPALNQAVEAEAKSVGFECEKVDASIRHGTQKNSFSIDVMNATSTAMENSEKEADKLAGHNSAVRQMEQENRLANPLQQTVGLTI